MHNWRAIKLVACILVVCLPGLCTLGACKSDQGGESEASGAFLQPNIDTPDRLWLEPVAPVAPKEDPSLQSEIPTGERAEFIEVDARGAFGGEVRRHDRIDLVLTAAIDPVVALEQAKPKESDKNDGDDEPSEQLSEYVSMSLLQNVTVLRAEASGRDDHTWVLTVSVTEREAQMLMAAQPIGEFFVLLRNRGDTQVGSVRRHTLARMLEDLEVINRARETRQKKQLGEPEAPTAAPLSSRIDSGMRAVALPMDIPAPVARHLRRGTRVDVSGVFDLTRDDQLVQMGARSGDSMSGTRGNFLSVSLLRNVKVLDTIGAEESASTGEGADKGEDAERSVDPVSVDPVSVDPMVIVEVTRDEAELLALSSQHGALEVALRAQGDTEISTIRGDTTRSMLEDLEVINRVREFRTRKRSRSPNRRFQVYMYRGGGSGSAASRSSASAPSRRAKQRAAKPKRNRESWGTHAASEPVTRVQRTEKAPRSTFALDVDTSSYTQVRRHLNEDELPDKRLVRVEEFVNYFDYDNPWPTTQPFAVTVEGAPSPFRRSKRHRLVRIGVQAKRATPGHRKPINLTFLVDTSHSMQGDDRLGLVKKALVELTENLGSRDHIAIVGYSNRVKQLLAPTSAEDKTTIIEAIQAIRAYGTTNMEAGMRRAYRLAHDNADPAAENRVIVLSDGAPNVGATTHGELLRKVAHEREEGITLSTIGFGRGNYRDELMEQLADKGDGNSYYVGDEDEAERLFGERLLSTLITVARDAKAQVEFDPAVVESYRRIGYVNRDLSDEDWHDPEVDAGEIGAGHRITMLYEVQLVEDAPRKALGTVRVRYKLPDGEPSFEIAETLSPEAMHSSFDDASEDLRFAASVVGFAEVLGEAPLGSYLSLAHIAQNAKQAAGGDPARLEFVELVERAQKLRQAQKAEAERARWIR